MEANHQHLRDFRGSWRPDGGIFLMDLFLVGPFLVYGNKGGLRSICCHHPVFYGSLCGSNMVIR